MNMLKKRSRGYTSVSVLITVLVLALVMLLNTVFSVLAAHYSLFVDLTNTELWTLSDEAKKVIAEAEATSRSPSATRRTTSSPPRP